MALAIVSVGLSNYGYALLLTHLLDVTAYSAFAASQSLILWALNSATASVPLILAQAIVRSTTEDERNSALRFVKLASVGIGLVAAAIVGAIVTRFGSPATTLVVALSIFVLFLGTTTTGWLQGLQRIRSLSILYIAENVLKNGTGMLLVTVAGLGATGALGAFGIGALAMLLRSPIGTSGVVLPLWVGRKASFLCSPQSTWYWSRYFLEIVSLPRVTKSARLCPGSRCT
jgi:O-antigen/teichoic acid export membrane protein